MDDYFTNNVKMTLVVENKIKDTSTGWGPDVPDEITQQTYFIRQLIRKKSEEKNNYQSIFQPYPESNSKTLKDFIGNVKWTVISQNSFNRFNK